MKTLEDARDGLVRYWTLRPSGGTRAELLQLAVQQGFEEPLLAVWLDIFLQGFVAGGRIDTADYDGNLAPFVAEVGLERAKVAVAEVFEYLTRPGRPLEAIRLQNLVAQLGVAIADTDAKLVLVDQGIALIPLLPPSNGARAALREAALAGRARLQAVRDSQARDRAQLILELAERGIS